MGLLPGQEHATPCRRTFNDLTSVQATTDASILAKLREKYSSEAARYKEDKTELEAEARKLEAEVATERNRADRYDLAEVFLEIGLVITSITLLSGRRVYWGLGIFFGALGLAVSATGLLIH